MANGLSENSRGLGSRQIFVFERRFEIVPNELVDGCFERRGKPDSMESGGE
jgi:hypothetical protein